MARTIELETVTLADRDAHHVVLVDQDACPGTPANVALDPKGCPLDSDMDGGADYIDQCPRTAQGVAVDARGCALDSDGDVDAVDQCPGTVPGSDVDAQGCERDDDGDGEVNRLDSCPDTPARTCGRRARLSRDLHAAGARFRHR